MKTILMAVLAGSFLVSLPVLAADEKPAAEKEAKGKKDKGDKKGGDKKEESKGGGGW